MDGKEIILKYLKEKNNEDEVIAFLQEQKKLLVNPKNSSAILSDDYIKSLVRLAKNSKGMIKYHTIIILSNVEICMNPIGFYELCRIADEGLKNKDGNVRQASYILVKNLNAIMIMLPIINEMQKASSPKVNLFYESFRKLFYQLYFRAYDSNEENIKKSALKSLEIMLPKFYDMAKFWKDNKEIGMANKIKEELNKHEIRN